MRRLRFRASPASRRLESRLMACAMDTARFSGRASRVLAPAGLVLLAALLAGGGEPRDLPAGPAAGGRAALRQDDRAAAYGSFLDARFAPTLVDESLALAEALRTRYGIRSGDPVADRTAAAARALAEVESDLPFGDAEIEAAARQLGYSLDPASCADTCGNVRRLAGIHLKMEALRRLGMGAPGSREPGGRRSR